MVRIGNSAFSGCERLANITIPESVTKINNFVFYKCDNLTAIYTPADSYAAQWAAKNGYAVKEPVE